MNNEEQTPSRATRSVRTDLVIRPARAEDRAALEAIAAQTWDGADYLPRVFDDWLAEGDFFVAEWHGQTVGAAKLSRLSEGEWWMQGLRVDPAFQGRGIGRMLHHFLVNRARQVGTGEIRFSTASTTRAIHRLARETGFRKELACVILRAPALDEPPQRWRALSVSALPDIWRWLERSAHFSRMRYSLEQSWTFYRMTQPLLRTRLAAGLVYGWMPNVHAKPQGVLVCNPPSASDEPSALEIGYLDVADAELRESARDARRLAAALGHDFVRIKPPKTQEADFERAGFRREWDGEVWLYARAVVLSNHAAPTHR